MAAARIFAQVKKSFGADNGVRPAGHLLAKNRLVQRPGIALRPGGEFRVGRCLDRPGALRRDPHQQRSGHLTHGGLQTTHPGHIFTHPGPHRLHALLVEQIQLVQNHHVGVAQRSQHYLAHVAVAALFTYRLGVGYHHHAVQSKRRQVGVLAQAHRIGHAAGFHQHVLGQRIFL